MTLSDRLRKIAKEIEDTAVGSSRVAMYHALAEELRAEAKKLDEGTA